MVFFTEDSDKIRGGGCNILVLTLTNYNVVMYLKFTIKKKNCDIIQLRLSLEFKRR
jgi:hypothetical protein